MGPGDPLRASPPDGLYDVVIALDGRLCGGAGSLPEPLLREHSILMG